MSCVFGVSHLGWQENKLFSSLFDVQILVCLLLSGGFRKTSLMHTQNGAQSKTPGDLSQISGSLFMTISSTTFFLANSSHTISNKSSCQVFNSARPSALLVFTFSEQQPEDYLIYFLFSQDSVMCYLVLSRFQWLKKIFFPGFPVV